MTLDGCGGLLVHEWIGEIGGSERVFQRLTEVLPRAQLLCLWQDDSSFATDRQIKETFLARTPLRRSKALSVPLMPLAWRTASRGHFDWGVVSTHLFSHHVRLNRGSEPPKLAYVHTPARYIWEPNLDQRGNNVPARALASLLKKRDRKMARSLDRIVANSEYVAKRIVRCWEREAEIIHPPVEVSRIQAGGDWRVNLGSVEREHLAALPAQFVLGASRFIPYKRLDLVIKAGEAADLPVVLAGHGPSEESLRNLAAASSVPVHFFPKPTTPALFALYQQASVYVFPAVEDFGMMPVEAMACGTPVVVNAEGGARESLSYPTGGEVFTSHSTAELRTAVDAAIRKNRSAVAVNARRFDATEFDRKILASLERMLSEA